MSTEKELDELIETLKAQVVDALDLDEVLPDDFSEDTPLFLENGLALDSIDALELIVLIEREHGLKIEDSKVRRSALYSIRTMAEFIRFGEVNPESIPEEVRERIRQANEKDDEAPLEENDKDNTVA